MDKLNCSNNHTSAFIELITTYRTELMGCAIIMVLSYHCYCWPTYNYYISLFRWGFFGVDIFILLSGFGLCHAYVRHKLLHFYSRRLMRLLPLFWIMISLSTLLSYWVYNDFNWMHYLCDLLTMSYYGIGGEYSDNWFIASILLLYLIFPILFKVIKWSPNFICFRICMSSTCLLYFFNIHWRYDCLIARLPIFA